MSNHTGLKLPIQSLRGYLKIACDSYELDILPNRIADAAKNHGKNYMKVRPPWSAFFV